MNFKDIFITKQVDFLNKSLLEKLTQFITSLIKHGNLGLARALRFVLSTIENFARGRNSILSGSSSFLSTKSDVCNCQHLFYCPNWFHFHRSGNLSLNPQCHSLLNFKSVEVVSHNPLIKTKSQNVQLIRSWLARWPSRWHCSTRSFSNWSTWQSCSLGFRSRSHSILSPASWSSSSDVTATSFPALYLVGKTTSLSGGGEEYELDEVHRALQQHVLLDAHHHPPAAGC